MWTKVLIIQCVLFLLTMCVGTVFLRMPFRRALLAASLVMPTPLFGVSPGSAGFIFASDIVAVVLAVSLLTGAIARRPGQSRLPSGVSWCSFLLLFVLPTATTLITYPLGTYRALNYVLLAHARNLGYLVTFRALAILIPQDKRPDRFLLLQLIGFLFVVACGMVQYSTGIDLDLWNMFRGIEVGTWGDRLHGGGFLGLYRGAVGAWGVGILAVAGVLLPTMRGGKVLLALLVPMVFGAMIGVGTRQGVAIGLAVFVCGLAIGVVQLSSGMRFKAFMGGMSGLLIVFVVCILAFSGLAGGQFKDWADKRFGFLSSLGAVIDVLKERDVGKREFVVGHILDSPQILWIGTGYGTDLSTYGGTASIYLDSEFLSIWQSNGSVLMFVYMLFILLMRARFRRAYRPVDPSANMFVLAGIVVLYGGILLLNGHFFLLCIYTHQSPVAYWNWAVLGGAVGLCAGRGRTGTSSEEKDDEYFDDFQYSNGGDLAPDNSMY